MALFKLVPVNGGKPVEFIMPDSGNKSWFPEMTVETKYNIPITTETPKGEYILNFKLIESAENATSVIQIGLNTNKIDTDGFIELGKINI